jgi:hypothetical protein
MFVFVSFNCNVVLIISFCWQLLKRYMMNDTIKKIGIKRVGEMGPEAWYEPCQKKFEYTKEGWQSHYTDLSTQWEAILLFGDFHAFKTI